MKRSQIRLARRSAQRGVTMLVVLVLMSVMLLGGLALARISEVGTLAFGNVSSRDAAMQASEVGLTAAFAAVNALAAEDTTVANWYRSTYPSPDTGMPTWVDWAAAPSVVVGRFTVSYVAERMCNTAPVTDQLLECVVRSVPLPNSRNPNAPQPDPPNVKQFRITVRVAETADVTGNANIGKGTQAWAQALVNKLN